MVNKILTAGSVLNNSRGFKTTKNAIKNRKDKSNLGSRASSIDSQSSGGSKYPSINLKVMKSSRLGNRPDVSISQLPSFILDEDDTTPKELLIQDQGYFEEDNDNMKSAPVRKEDGPF